MTAPATGAARAGLEGVYREHFAFVWRSLRRLGVPDADLPDAVHDTFLVVHRRLDSYDAECQLTTWLYGICLRVASGRRRRASARRERLEDPPPLSSRPGDHEGKIAERADRRRLLQHALDAMPDDQRAVFALFELEGWSGDRIAAALSIPLATVHSRLRLARASFRKHVEAWQSRQRFDQQRPRVV